MSEPRRQTAYKCAIKQILEGRYVQQQGWEPNYVEVGSLKISRVNVLASIVSKDSNNITVDDGTGQISLMLFQNPEKADNLKIGEIVLIIGRPREYNNQKYLVPEIMKKLEDKKWIKYRKKELGEDLYKKIKTEPKKKIEKPEVISPQNQNQNGENRGKKIIDSIRKLDTGDGANVEDVISESGVEGAEAYIKNLINEGEIFEIRAGKVKVLD